MTRLLRELGFESWTKSVPGITRNARFEKLQSSAVVLLGLRCFSVGGQPSRECRLRIGEVGIQFHGSSQMLAGFRRRARCHQDVSQAEVNFSLIRLQFQSFAIVLLSLLKLALARVNPSQVEEGFGVVRGHLERI